MTFLYGCLYRFLAVFIHPFSILTWKGLPGIVYNLTRTGVLTPYTLIPRIDITSILLHYTP